jgi:hypothetical protein
VISLAVVPGWMRIALASALIGGAILAVKAWKESLREEGRAEARAECMAERERMKDAALRQAAANAQETQRRLAAQKEAQDAHDKEVARARADAVAARSASDRLRRQLAAVASDRRAAAGHPAAAAHGAPTDLGFDLLSDMFSLADQAAGELAERADEARAAGLQCQRAHEALTAPKP